MTTPTKPRSSSIIQLASTFTLTTPLRGGDQGGHRFSIGARGGGGKKVQFVTTEKQSNSFFITTMVMVGDNKQWSKTTFHLDFQMCQQDNATREKALDLSCLLLKSALPIRQIHSTKVDMESRFTPNT
ncbi:hypothetical protein ACFX14_000278 [Malus domestica]